MAELPWSSAMHRELWCKQYALRSFQQNWISDERRKRQTFFYITNLNHQFTIELQNHPKWLKNCNIFLLQQVHRFNNRNFNFNSKYSKCNHQLNRKHFTVKRQVLPWFLAASMLSQLKQRRLQADTAMVNAAMAVAGWRTALDIGASSEAGWRWLKCWSCICFLLHGFYCYDSSCSSPISLRSLLSLGTLLQWPVKTGEAFRDEGLPLNLLGQNTIIHQLSSTWQMASLKLEKLQSGELGPPDVISFNSILEQSLDEVSLGSDLCCLSEAWKCNFLRVPNVPLTFYLYKSLYRLDRKMGVTWWDTFLTSTPLLWGSIAAHESGGQWILAAVVLDKLMTSTKPSSISFNSMTSTAASSGQLREAFSMKVGWSTSGFMPKSTSIQDHSKSRQLIAVA